MVGRVSSLSRVFLLSALLSSLLGCVSWPQARREIVEPIHELLHHTWPDALVAGDAAAIEALFTTPDAAAESLALRAGFAEVKYAIGAIERVDLEVEPVRGWVEIRLDGTAADDGRLRTVHQRREVTLARTAEGWSIASDRPQALREATAPASYFYDEARLRGLWFTHEEKPLLGLDGEPRRYVFGSGLAAVDLDENGYDDVLIASGGHVELFLNEKGYFTRASEAWGLGASAGLAGPGIITAVVPADFDGDGDRDLFLGAEYAQPRLLRNDGGRFTPVAESGIATPERTIAATAADFDGDGRLDLFVANHEDVFREAPAMPNARNATRDQIFLGDGALGFTDATETFDLDNPGWSLSPAPADMDGDGDVDLFVGNDFGLDVLLRNDGGRFAEISREAGVDRPVAAMGADWGDYDADGDLDLFVAGMASGSGWILEVPQFRLPGLAGAADLLFRPYVREAVRSWFRGNRLYENLGDGTFRERAAESGAAINGWGWAPVWLDFDNDGHLDLYAVNGFLSGPIKDDL